MKKMIVLVGLSALLVVLMSSFASATVLQTLKPYIDSETVMTPTGCSSSQHYNCVDDSRSPDGDTTKLTFTATDNNQSELFALTNTLFSSSEQIDAIAVYFYTKQVSSTVNSFEVHFKDQTTGDLKEYEYTIVPGTDWAYRVAVLSESIFTGNPWTKTELDNLIVCADFDDVDNDGAVISQIYVNVIQY